MSVDLFLKSSILFYCSLPFVRWFPYFLEYNDIVFIRYSLTIIIPFLFGFLFIKKSDKIINYIQYCFLFSSFYLIFNSLGLIFGEERESFVFFRDLIYLNLIFISAIYIKNENKDNIINFYLLIFGLLSTIHILGSYRIITFNHPVEGKDISTTGLGELSTEWSSSLAIIALMYFLLRKKSIFSLFSFVLIYSSQIIVNGRAGILATTIGIILFSIFQKKYKNLLLIGILLFVFLIRPTENFNRYQDHIFYDQRVVKNYNTGYIHNNKEFFQNLESIGCTSFCLELIEKLDIISSYRIQQWITGIFNFFRNPLGKGFGNAPIWVSGAEREFHIHNVFIRMANEGGFMSFIFCIIIISIPIVFFPSEYKIYFTTSAIPAFFEPRFIFNAAIEQSSIWWLMYFIIFKSCWDTYKSQKRLSI